MIKFVSDLRLVDGCSAGTPVSSTNNADRHDITEILLKVASNTITLTPSLYHIHYKKNGLVSAVYQYHSILEFAWHLYTLR